MEIMIGYKRKEDGIKISNFKFQVMHGLLKFYHIFYIYFINTIIVAYNNNNY